MKSGPRPTTATVSPGPRCFFVSNVAVFTGVLPISFGSYDDDGEVVQRMDVLDAARDLERARESEPHVAHRDGHRVAVDDDPAALGVGDEARAVVVAIGDARHRVRHVEVHEHERRRDRLHVPLALARERRAFARRHAARAAAPAASGLHGHIAERVVAVAARAGNQLPVVRDDPLPLALRLVEAHEAHGDLAVVGQRLEHALRDRRGPSIFSLPMPVTMLPRGIAALPNT